MNRPELPAELVALMKRAERRVAAMDAADRRRGDAAPADAPPLQFWDTILMALGAGLTHLVKELPDGGRGSGGLQCVAEAAVMLGQIPGIHRWWDQKPTPRRARDA
jgi:hypothetical protein